MEPYWNEANGHVPHSVKYESEAAVSSFPYCTESSLNFSTNATAFSEDDAEYSTGVRRNKTSRQDPLSHRIIEKRRRDRMNSCLADLSRLIPPQYQRKGRGRIEKTEIIEMAIRHLRHLQGECMQKENEYRLGYTDCMKEAAKFLYDSQMQEFCYRLLARLQEHCDEVIKSECFRQRGCHTVSDNVSASSGSPHHGYHGSNALCHLRDILPISDIEHSNDHNDVKDLSFRNHLHQLQRPEIVNAVHESYNNNNNNHHQHHHTNDNANNGNAAVHRNGIISHTETKSPSNMICSTNSGNDKSLNCKNVINNSDHAESVAQLPHQAPIITSTATSSTLQHHTDSSNHDFDSSGEPMSHADTSTMHSPPPRNTLLAHGSHHQQSQHDHHEHHRHHHHDHRQSDSPINHNSDSLLLQERLRNFSESSHDVEHNNNYKYKNHIKERFNHELHDEETSSEHCLVPPMLQSEHSHSHSEHSKDGTEPEIAPIIAKKRKLAEAAAAAAASAAVGGSIPLIQSDSNISTNSNPNTNDIRLRMARHLTATAINTPTQLNPIIMAKEEKLFGAFGDIKAETSSSSSGINVTTNTAKSTLLNVSSSTSSTRNFPVPIFALHSQGAYYVPLTVDYSALLPYLNGVDLLQRNYPTMPTVHPINVNVNFTPSIVTTVTVCKE